jgi:hypothetical protein
MGLYSRQRICAAWLADLTNAKIAEFLTPLSINSICKVAQFISNTQNK